MRPARANHAWETSAHCLSHGYEYFVWGYLDVFCFRTAFTVIAVAQARGNLVCFLGWLVASTILVLVCVSLSIIRFWTNKKMKMHSWWLLRDHKHHKSRWGCLIHLLCEFVDRIQNKSTYLVVCMYLSRICTCELRM